jgi:hypothetical protein
VGDNDTVVGVGALIGDDNVVGDITGTLVGDDDDVVVEIGAWIGANGSVGAVIGQLVCPLSSKQHVHTILAQSILISTFDTEHNVDGMVPANCVLLNTQKLVSCVSCPNVDGIVPVNRLPRKRNSVSCFRLPNVDGTVPFN